MTKMTKKAQLEIMGLAIILILFVIGIFFAVSTLSEKQPLGLKKSFSKTQQTSNFGTALLKASTINCSKTTLQDLIADCSENFAFRGFITCEDGRKSCDYVNETVTSILNETFNQWVVPYSISIYETPSSEEFVWTHLGCTDKKPGRAEFFPLPTASFRVVNLKIYICDFYEVSS